MSNGFQAVNNGHHPSSYKTSVRSIATVDGIHLPLTEPKVLMSLCCAKQASFQKTKAESTIDLPEITFVPETFGISQSWHHHLAPVGFR